MTVLLALSLAAIVRSPPWTPEHAEQESAGQPGPPEPTAGPPAGQLPRRLPGESGRVAPANGEPVFTPDASQPPRVSGGPPWGPAPKPPDRPYPPRREQPG